MLNIFSGFGLHTAEKVHPSCGWGDVRQSHTGQAIEILFWVKDREKYSRPQCYMQNIKAQWSVECYFETVECRWTWHRHSLLIYLFKKYWKARTECVRTACRPYFIFCHGYNNGVLMILWGASTLFLMKHQRGPETHKMGHFLGWLEVWCSHLLIFEHA